MTVDPTSTGVRTVINSARGTTPAAETVREEPKPTPKEPTEEEKKQQELSRLQGELHTTETNIRFLEEKLRKASIETNGTFFDKYIERIKINARRERKPFGINNRPTSNAEQVNMSENEQKYASDALKLYNLRLNREELIKQIEILGSNIRDKNKA